ncbi:MAG: hypothetical protein QXT64_04360 [Desulfurococcaceae archaeon]
MLLYAGLKFLVLVSFAVLLILLVAPLVVFLADFLENPECLLIRSVETRELNETHYEVNLEVSYCSTIEIKRLEMQIGETSIVLNNVQKGARVIPVVLSRGDVEQGLRKIRLSIAGLYELEINPQR